MKIGVLSFIALSITTQRCAIGNCMEWTLGTNPTHGLTDLDCRRGGEWAKLPYEDLPRPFQLDFSDKSIFTRALEDPVQEIARQALEVTFELVKKENYDGDSTAYVLALATTFRATYHEKLTYEEKKEETAKARVISETFKLWSTHLETWHNYFCNRLGDDYVKYVPKSESNYQTTFLCFLFFVHTINDLVPPPSPPNQVTEQLQNNQIIGACKYFWEVDGRLQMTHVRGRIAALKTQVALRGHLNKTRSAWSFAQFWRLKFRPDLDDRFDNVIINTFFYNFFAISFLSLTEKIVEKTRLADI